MRDGERGRRIVFLDVDGVLNSHAWWARKAFEPAHPQLDPEAVARLDRLCRETGAAVVVSSTWRSAGATHMREVLGAVGFKGRVIGCTPQMARMGTNGVYLGVERGHEIAQWLSTFPRPVERFVILDDEDDMADLRGFLVQTDYAVGLTDADCERAAAMLAGEAA